MDPRIRQALWGSVIALGVALLLGACLPQTALAGELRRFPAYAPESSEPKDEVGVDELREIIEQARKLKKAREEDARAEDSQHAVPAPPPAKPGFAEKAAAKTAEETVAEAGEDTKPGEDVEPGEDAEADAAPKPAATPDVAAGRAGCMYRGTTLIWEKVPGACEP